MGPAGGAILCHDIHIIEVGENMKMVYKRFLDSGMMPEQMPDRMDVPLKFVKGCM